MKLKQHDISEIESIIIRGKTGLIEQSLMKEERPIEKVIELYKKAHGIWRAQKLKPFISNIIRDELEEHRKKRRG